MGEHSDKMSLEEYAAAHQHELTEPERKAQAAAARSYTEKQEQAAQLADMKAHIIRQLESGAEPQTILYSAISALGLATDDPAWTGAAHEKLESLYSDLAQRSFLTDEAAIAAERMNARHEEYCGKLQRQLLRQVNACRQLEKDLQAALNTIEKARQDGTQEAQELT